MAKLDNFHQSPNRRRLASLEGCKYDLEEHLKNMFLAFQEALIKYNKELAQTPPEARARAFEASLLNSKMIASIQKHFPKNWRFGKYKRFILRIEGYIVLFKKLNKFDKPMNIKTKMVSAINSQTSLSLFNDESFIEDPILYFGYQKNKLGNIVDPKLVYIDEDQVKWTISQNDLPGADNVNITTSSPVAPTATPTLRETAKKKSS